ncbi:unnamed protein product, partial [Prorocentrum cordatum]
MVAWQQSRKQWAWARCAQCSNWAYDWKIVQHSGCCRKCDAPIERGGNCRAGVEAQLAVNKISRAQGKLDGIAKRWNEAQKLVQRHQGQMDQAAVEAHEVQVEHTPPLQDYTHERGQEGENAAEEHTLEEQEQKLAKFPRRRQGHAGAVSEMQEMVEEAKALRRVDAEKRRKVGEEGQPAPSPTEPDGPPP